METEPIPIFLNICLFAYAIPVIVGFVYWKCLTRFLKIYWLWLVVAFVDVVLIWVYDYHDYTRIIVERALLTVVMGVVTGWFYIELLHKRSEKIVIGMCYAALISYNLFDWWSYGSQLHYNRVSFADYILVAVSSFILLRKLLFQKGRFQKPIFVALMTLFIEHFLGTIFSVIAEPLFRYFSGYWFSLIWYNVVPASCLLYVGMATYALYLSGQTQRNPGKIPELESIG